MSDPSNQADPTRLPFLFFFSYARSDKNRYLERFYEDLVERLERKVARSGVSFRDLPEIEPGDDWEETLVDALQTSRTLLCIYTPYYFKRPYCGKEFAVFLQRQGATVDDEGVVRESRRIIPVLWMKEADLQRHGLPPALVRAIQYSVTQHQDLYREKGLEGILREKGRRGPYHAIVEELADLIWNRSEPELAQLAQKPSLAAVQNVFEQMPPAPQAAPGGPQVLRLFHLAAHGEGADPLQLHAAVQEVALRMGVTCAPEEVDPAAQDAGAALLSALAAATARNEVALVVAPASREGRLARLLDEVAAGAGWRGGILLLPGAAGEAPLKAADALAQKADMASVVVTHFQGAAPELPPVLRQLIEGLQRRVIATGEVRRQVAAPGPERRPLVAGPREDLRNVA
jgi:hypothetical protein